MNIRRFTESGHVKYIKLYNKIKDSINEENKNIEKGYTAALQNQIKILQEDISNSEEIFPKTEVKSKSFKDSYEFGVYLNKLLDKQEYSNISFDKKLWDWLALFYFENIFSSNARGYNENRYILSDDWFTVYRHLVRTPWYVVRTYGKFAKLFLSGPPYFGKDWLEQFISHRICEKYIKSAEISYYLYYDEKEDKPKPGYSKKFIRVKNKKTLVKASLGRLVDKLNQYNEIYNIWDMDTKDIINLLPKEFNKLRI
jgi:hypothetical protein